MLEGFASFFIPLFHPWIQNDWCICVSVKVFSACEFLYLTPRLCCKHSAMALREVLATVCRWTLNLGLPEKINCNPCFPWKLKNTVKCCSTCSLQCLMTSVSIHCCQSDSYLLHFVLKELSYFGFLVIRWSLCQTSLACLTFLFENYNNYPHHCARMIFLLFLYSRGSSSFKPYFLKQYLTLQITHLATAGYFTKTFKRFVVVLILKSCPTVLRLYEL